MRYYGCKTKLLDYIEEVVSSLNLGQRATFFDIFSGTSAVGVHFKQLGYTVYSNDFLEFAHAIANCYIETNLKPRFTKLERKISSVHNSDDVIKHLNNLKGKIGFITKNYSPYKTNKRQYLSTENAKKVDSIRECINTWKTEKLITNSEYYFILTALIESINLVSNVTGTYAAYLKNWDPRAFNKITLTPPTIIQSKSKNIAIKSDANDIVGKYNVDVLYLDPPYNSRQFASNYFLLELVAEGWFDKKPKIYGLTGMRPYDHQKSRYSRKADASKALADLVNKARAKYIILSYNDEGIIPINEIEKILSTRGKVKKITKNHKRYRAINQDGSNVVTKELLFLVKTK